MANSDKNPDSPPPATGSAGIDPIQTQRLLLRPFAQSDAATVEMLLADKEIASNCRNIQHPYPEGGGAEWIATHGPARETGDGYAFAIVRSDDDGKNPLIGAIGLEVNKENHNAELGYWIGREFWNRGYCTEAAIAVIEFGFETLGLHRICSEHMARNPASGKVMEKAGLTREGLRRHHVRKWGAFEDVVVYGMLSGDRRP